MPQRLQRSRQRGWRKPEGAVIVDRTSRWGNPFRLEGMRREFAGARPELSPAEREDAARAELVAAFNRALIGGRLRVSVADVRAVLRGKDLICFCPLDKACHADVLLRIANATALEAVS